MSTGTSLSDSKAKSGSLSSSFGCFLSVLNTDEEKPYPFWSIYLHYPEEVVQNAGNNRSGYKYRLKNSDGEIYLMANCIIPGTAEGLRLVDQLLRDSIRHYEKKNESNKSYSPSLVASAGDWCSQANSEGFYCQPGDCWLDSGMNTCCGPDGCGFPEVEVVSEIEEYTDCGDVPIPWSPPELEDPEVPWNPDDPGSGGEPCLDCEPGDDPNDPGDNDDNEEEPCDTIGEEGCEEEFLKPCEGNPVKNPRIAPQKNSGINGGQFGFTRSSGQQFHNGIDIVNEVGNPFYAMHGGTVVSVGYEPDGIGYFVTIQSFINGEYYTHQYGHLQKNGRPTNGTIINVGTVIGVQGLSGNLEGAVISGMTVPHTHIVVRKRIGSGWNLKNDYSTPKNPLEIMTTQFNSLGNPISETDC